MPEPLAPHALDGLLELAGGDQEFVGDLIDGYLSESPDLIADLNGGDDVALMRAAHTLKSTSANFGADQLATICAQLERAARSGGRSPDLVAAAEREYAAVRAALLRERERLP